MSDATRIAGQLLLAGTLAVASAAASAAIAVAAAPANGAAAAPEAPNCAIPLLSKSQPAAQVAKSNPKAFGAAARRSDVAASRLASLAKDKSLWLDRCGRRFYVEEKATAGAANAPVAAAAQPNSPVPLADTFTLESKPGSSRTIYLDFNGGTVNGTEWNVDYGNNIVAAPHSNDATVDTNFSNAELTEIQRAWQVVAEDYAPFDVNVTLRDPGAAAIDRTDANDQVFGTHVYMTNGGVIYDDCGCGGVAYVGVFTLSGANHARYQPAWVFSSGTGTGGKNMGEAAAHEVGHNFGLSHDGTATSGYYQGAAPWAPIMGASYSQPVSHWSTGEYPGGTNHEDDLSIIARGAPLRADDHGNTAATASNLGAGAGATVNGVIGGRADVDAFRFTGAGSTTVTLKGAAGLPNLDAKLTILNASGGVVATVDPAVARVSGSVASGMDATWTANLPAGGATYTALVDGVGSGDPAVAGRYSDYGSIGNYEVGLTTGSPTVNTVTVTNPGAQTGKVGTAKSLQIQASDSASGQTLTYSATGLPSGLSINPSTGLISGTPTAAGSFTTTVSAKDTTNASGSTTFTWTISPATTACTGQKLGNPGFETGTSPWAATSGVIDNSSGRAARSGSWKAWLNGYGETHTDRLSQSVTIPAGCKATLSFYLHIDTDEDTTTVAYDKLAVRAGSTTLATYSNLHAADGYVRRSFDLSSFAGQTVTISFTGTEDYSLQTSFVVDDTALTLS